MIYTSSIIAGLSETGVKLCTQRDVSMDITIIEDASPETNAHPAYQGATNGYHDNTTRWSWDIKDYIDKACNKLQQCTAEGHTAVEQGLVHLSRDMADLSRRVSMALPASRTNPFDSPGFDDGPIHW
jgi:hypothetical protein